MNTKQVRMKNFEIKNFYEFLNKIAMERGVSVAVTECVLKNLKELDSVYKDVLSGIFNPETDKNVIQYKQDIQKIQFQFADKNEKGEVILTNGKIQITEKFQEYEAAIKELNEKNAQIIQMVNNAPAYNNQYMNGDRDVTLNVLESYPDETHPLLVYYLTK